MIDILLSPHSLAALIGGYFIGSIPFGLLLTRLAGLGDVRNIGSGNIGATNVLRTGHRGLAAATLALDTFKGTLAVLLAYTFVAPPEAAILVGLVAGLGAFLGHLFPVWLGFNGGKGVATYIGVLAGAAPAIAALFCAIWLVVAVASRYSSLAALAASVAVPMIALLAGQPAIAIASLVMTALLLWKHRTNILRLRRGEEPKIGHRAR